MSKATLSKRPRKEVDRLAVKRLAQELGLPIFPHASGRWANKRNGAFMYFGRWNKGPADGDWQAAMELYEKRKDGADETEAEEKRTTVSKLFNDFLNAARGRVESGELSSRTFYDYNATAKHAAKFFGRRRVVETIRPAEWTAFRGKLARGRNLQSLKKEIVQTRMVAKWGVEAGLLDHLPRFGPEFKPPKKDKLQIAKNKAREKNGAPTFTAQEIRTILAAAKPSLKAMVLLGVNCAFGQSDISRLPFSALDLEGGWVTFARGKTGQPRRAKLWPETVEALRLAIDERPEPKSAENENLVFITSHGAPWVKVNAKGMPSDSVGQEFTKLLNSIDTAAAEQAKKESRKPPREKLRKARRSFYGLRHTHETVGSNACDQVALDYVMGHVDSSMAANYRHEVADARLDRVADVVRAWLFGKEAAQ